MNELTRSQQANLEVSYSDLDDDIVMEERHLGNQYYGPRAMLQADHFPSPVFIHKNPEFLQYRLSAEWKLPDNLDRQTFSNIRQLQGAAVRSLSKAKLTGYDFPVSEDAELWASPNEPKRVKISSGQPAQVNASTFNGVSYRESYEDGNLGVEASHPEWPSSIKTMKPKNDHFLCPPNAEFDLPAQLQSSYVNFHQFRNAIEHCRSKGLLP